MVPGRKENIPEAQTAEEGATASPQATLYQAMKTEHLPLDKQTFSGPFKISLLVEEAGLNLGKL